MSVDNEPHGDLEKRANMPTVARAEYDPFVELNSTELKFISISGDTLKKASEASGQKIDPNLFETGVIVFGTDMQDHWMIVNENLGLDRKYIRDALRYRDSGMVAQGNDPQDILIVTPGSGELIADNNTEFVKLSPKELHERHIQTANTLNSIYTGENGPRYVFRTIPPRSEI